MMSYARGLRQSPSRQYSITSQNAGSGTPASVFARRRRHWLAEQRRRRDAATSVTLPVALVPEDDAREAADAPTAPLTSPRRRQSQAAATDVL